MLKTISIITALYNRVNTIQETLESVSSQTHPPDEYIIIDGASTDGSQEVVENFSFDEKIKGITISESDCGVYDAINKGILISKSDVLGLLHSDDVFASSATIEKVMVTFSSDPALDIVYGDLVIFDRDLQKPIRYWKSGEFRVGCLRKGWMPPHPTLFVHKRVFEKYGLYDTSYKVSADYDFILRIFKNGDFKSHYIPDVLVHMRSGGLSSRHYWDIIKEDYKAIKQNGVGGVGTLLCKYIRSASQLYRKYRLIT